MEAVNNIMSTATKTIWGDKAGEEPVNGQTGAGTVNEPYDKGNDSTTGGAPTEGATDNRINSTQPSSEPTSNPAASGAVPHQKQQGADRPDAEPSDAQIDAVKDKKDAAESALNSDSTPKITSDEEREKLAEKGELPHDPNDHSGEPMKMHNAGGAGGDPREEAEAGKPKDRSASVAQEGGGEHGKVKGTGEQWVKSTGIAAEGGDFDVTKPGAGREATRLMEEKGIKTDSATIDATTNPSSTSEEKEKVSKLAKLKEKMHIGTGKHLG